MTKNLFSGLILTIFLSMNLSSQIKIDGVLDEADWKNAHT